jgi:hypothetical protein
LYEYANQPFTQCEQEDTIKKEARGRKICFAQHSILYFWRGIRVWHNRSKVYVPALLLEKTKRDEYLRQLKQVKEYQSDK